MNRVKYPRTFHLPFSMGRTNDDKVLRSTDHFLGKQVIVTLKMDGENTTMYRDYFHARSIDSRHHSSRDWLAGFHSTIAHDIPEDWRICGENLYARHSIAYNNLSSYFMGFSVWNDKNQALCWDDTLEYFELLNITPVTQLYRGEFDEKILIDLAKSLDTENNEGFVVRLTDSIDYNNFAASVGKWVRASHVQTSEHWMHSDIVANQLIDNK